MKKFSLFLFLSFCVVLHSQESSLILPTTMSECYTLLDGLLTEDTKTYIKNLESVDGMLEFHFSTGIYIRNNWLRHGDAELLNNINKNNWDVGYDDISSAILTGYWYYLRGMEYDWGNDLEAASRYNRSLEPPKNIPQNLGLKKTENRYYYSYLYNTIITKEVLHAYYENELKQYYIYSLHFGWFILTEEEFKKFSKDPIVRKQLIETKEKIFY